MFNFTNKVVKGRGNGKSKLGFATANMVLPHTVDSIQYRVRSGIVGAWTLRVIVDGEIKLGFCGVSINGTDLVFEVHIIDFDRDIYGETINIIFIDKIREQIIFKNIEEAKEQIKKDYDFTMTKINDFKSCANCKFLCKQDTGYSNYTVEGTECYCLIAKNPAMDSADNTVDVDYNGNTEAYKFANGCSFYNPGDPWHLDVDGEEERPTDAWIKEELREISIKVITDGL